MFRRLGLGYEHIIHVDIPIHDPHGLSRAGNEAFDEVLGRIKRVAEDNNVAGSRLTQTGKSLGTLAR